jgi:hypothetical protein
MDINININKNVSKNVSEKGNRMNGESLIRILILPQSIKYVLKVKAISIKKVKNYAKN